MGEYKIEAIPSRSVVPEGTSSQIDVRIRIIPPTGEGVRGGPPLNLGIVIDRSSSMEGEKMDYVKESVLRMADRLLETDRLNIVTFSEEAYTVVESRPVRYPEDIEAEIQGISAEGEAALHAGWLQGAITTSKSLDPNAYNRVILFSGGGSEFGGISTDVIASDMKGLSERGVTTSIVGIGKDCNKDFLKTLCESGGGDFTILESPRQVPELVDRLLGRTPSNEDASIRFSVTPAENVRFLGMIGNFEKIGELEWRLPDMREGRCLDFSLGFEIEAGKGSNSLCSAELSGRAHKNGNVLGKIKTVKVLGVSEEDYVRISEKPDDLEEGRREMFVKLCGGPVLGDLTAPPPAREFPVEAIVNSTDVLLSRVGELSKAVHRAAGPELEEECRRIGRCGVGKAVVTKGYDLPAEWIIHTVCLPFSTAEIHAVDILYECFENCIKAAVERGIRTLAFPAIGVGAMQFPPGVAAKTAMRSIVSLLSSYREIESVLFVCRTERIKSYYDEAFSAITGRSPHPLTKEERDDSSL